MKVILDTNVIVSGIFFGGKPREILSMWRHKKFTLVITQEILTEYIEITESLSKRYAVSNAVEILENIAAHAEMTFASPLTQQVCEDADDDIFLAAAIASRTKIIVSGDKLLKKVSGWNGIQIAAPSVFLSDVLKKQ